MPIVSFIRTYDDPADISRMSSSKFTENILSITTEVWSDEREVPLPGETVEFHEAVRVEERGKYKVISVTELPLTEEDDPSIPTIFAHLSPIPL